MKIQTRILSVFLVIVLLIGVAPMTEFPGLLDGITASAINEIDIDWRNIDKFNKN